MLKKINETNLQGTSVDSFFSSFRLIVPNFYYYGFIFNVNSNYVSALVWHFWEVHSCTWRVFPRVAKLLVLVRRRLAGTWSRKKWHPRNHNESTAACESPWVCLYSGAIHVWQRWSLAFWHPISPWRRLNRRKENYWTCFHLFWNPPGFDMPPYVVTVYRDIAKLYDHRRSDLMSQEMFS